MALSWLGCAVPMLLATHDPKTLLEAPIAPEAGPAFDGRTIVLVFEGDASVTPVGGMLDDLHRSVTPVQQTYVIPEPGYVLFESLARVLSERGAEVYRSYGPLGQGAPLPEAQVTVAVAVQDIEMHYWRTSRPQEGNSDFHLLRAQVSLRVGDSVHKELVITRVPSRRDVFDAAAGQLASALRARIP